MGEREVKKQMKDARGKKDARKQAGRAETFVFKITVGRYRCVSLQKLVSRDGLVQARFAHVDVAVLGEG